jgi:hypothetical protein
MPEDTYTEVDYRNKPYYHQIKRLEKKVLNLGNLTQPKSIGFWLQNIRSITGSSQQMAEKIMRAAFGKDQKLSGNDLYARLKKHESNIPGGEPQFVRHETGYQQTQRLIPGHGGEEDDDEDNTKPKAKYRGLPVNKTLQISALGDVYTKILDKYKSDPNLDSVVRHINSSLAGHFKDAGTFVRWTVMTPAWIHIDAFQTDFFNKLKAQLYDMEVKQKQRGGEATSDPEEKLMKSIIDDLRSNEDELFKTGVSYVMRTHPGVKMWTCNTQELVKVTENMRGEVKGWELYKKLPEKLGFRLIKLTDLEKKLHLSQEKNALMKHFKPAIQKIGEKGQVTEEMVDAVISNISNKIDILISERKKDQIGPVQKSDIDEIIQSVAHNAKLASALHQLLDELTVLVNKKISKPVRKLKIGEATTPKTSIITAYLKKKKPYIMEFVNKVEGPGANIWWADRRMVFESTRFENRYVLEDMRRLAGLIRD